MRRPSNPTRSAGTAARVLAGRGRGAGPPPGRLLERQDAANDGLADPATVGVTRPGLSQHLRSRRHRHDEPLPAHHARLPSMRPGPRRECGPMELPADFPQLTVPEQLFVAIDRERVDRGLAPFTGLTTALDADAQKGADAARLPARPGPALRLGEHRVDRGCRQRARCRLRMDVQRRPGQRRPGVLGDARRRAAGPTGRSSSTGSGHGTSSWEPPTTRPATHRAKTAADPRSRPRWPPRPGAGRYAYTWKQALAAMSAGTLRPLRAIPASESDTGIGDPTHNVAPVPDYTRVCVAGRDRQFPGLSRRRAGRHQPRPRTGRDPPHGAAGGLRPDEHSRSALRRREPREGGPGAAGLRRADGRARIATRKRVRTMPTTRPTRGRPTTSTTRSGPAGRPTGSTRCTGGCTTTASTAATWTACTGGPPAAGATARASSTTSVRVPTW